MTRFVEGQNDLSLSHLVRPRPIHRVGTMPETQRLFGFSRPSLRFAEIQPCSGIP
jgi:hypothetical protein